jgi:hypothetical protein
MYMHSRSYRRAMREDRAELERALPGGIGYRLVPVEVAYNDRAAVGGLLTVKQRWANRNARWCPRPYHLKAFLSDASGITAFSATDQNFDPRPFVAGSIYARTSTFRLPADLPAGDYTLRLALIDEAGEPRVRLGIVGGMAKMVSVKVVKVVVIVQAP